MKKIRIGLIGGGFIGRAHATAYKNIMPIFGPDIQPELVVMGDANESIAKRIQESHQFSLDNSSVDGMIRTAGEVAALQKNFPDAKYVVLLPEMYTDLMTGKQTMPATLSNSEWETMFKNIRRIDKYIRDTHGLIPTLHPHVECHIQTEEEIEKVLDNTDIALCLDTGHHIYGGGEPVSFYQKHHERIPYIHIKDCDMAIKKEMTEKGWPFAEAVVKGIMCEPGKGGIDFKQFFGAMNDAGYDGWAVVEQDLYPVPSFDLPLEIATRTRQYLHSVGV